MGEGRQRVSGRCLCGAVTFDVTLSDGTMNVCHCGMCRRWTAGVLMYMSVDPHDAEIRGEPGVYRSSDEGERLFCKACGSSLFWRKPDGSQLDVSAQAIDDSGRFPFASEIFIEDQPANYAFANETRRISGSQSNAERLGEGSDV